MGDSQQPPSLWWHSVSLRRSFSVDVQCRESGGISGSLLLVAAAVSCLLVRIWSNGYEVRGEVERGKRGGRDEVEGVKWGMGRGGGGRGRRRAL